MNHNTIGLFWQFGLFLVHFLLLFWGEGDGPDAIPTLGGDLGNGGAGNLAYWDMIGLGIFPGCNQVISIVG